MDLKEFAELHVPALEDDKVRFNLEISAMTAAVKARPAGFRHWTLGGPGHCAIQWPGRAIVLATLDQDECSELASATMQIEYPGVRGSGQTPHWFVQQATAMGVNFEEPIPQRIHVLSGPPRHPGAAGSARSVFASDTQLLFEWLVAFHKEALPHDRPPQRENVEKAAASGRFLFWTGLSTTSPSPSRLLRDACAIRELSPPFTRRPSDAGVGMQAQRLPRLSSSSSQRERALPASTPICAILRRTAAMPRSASGRTASLGTICAAPRRLALDFRNCARVSDAGPSRR
jgi:hypothetical protein